LKKIKEGEASMALVPAKEGLWIVMLFFNGDMSILGIEKNQGGRSKSGIGACKESLWM